MTAKQSVDRSGRVSADPVSLHVRGRAGAKGSVSSLSPCDEKSGRQAVTIGWLLHWAYAREKVHLARPQGLDPAARSMAPRMGNSDSSDKLGAMITSSLNLGFEAPRDAYAVERAVDGLGATTKLVREYALIDARPDWTPHPAIRVVRGKAGHTLHIDNRQKRRLCEFRLVSYRGDLPEIVEERRRVYAVWARAVRTVHRRLAATDILTSYELTDDVPPLSPWDGLTD